MRIIINIYERYNVKKKTYTFWKTIKLRLVELEMKQEDLAKLVGTTPQYVSHIMYGERSGEKYREKICQVLDL